MHYSFITSFLALALLHSSITAQLTYASEPFSPVPRIVSLRRRALRFDSAKLLDLLQGTSATSKPQRLIGSAPPTDLGLSSDGSLTSAMRGVSDAEPRQIDLSDGREIKKDLKPKTADETQSIADQVSNLRKQWSDAASDEELQSIIGRRIHLLEAQLWPLEALKPVDGQTNWLISAYVESWKRQGFQIESMIELGQALGIREREVIPITSQSFDRLQNLLNNGRDFNYNSAKVKDMLEWYQSAKMPSLTLEGQETIAFNVGFANKRPWWTENQMRVWELQSVPWRPVAQIGDLLNLGDWTDIPLSRGEVIELRKKILSILKNFAAFDDIEKMVNPRDPVARGDIAKILKQSSWLPQSRRSKNLVDNFDLHFKHLAPNPNEEIAIRDVFLNKDGIENIEDHDLHDLIHMQLLLHGIYPSKAATFAKDLEFVRGKSAVELFKRGGEGLSHLRGLLPEFADQASSRGTLDRLQVYFKAALGSHLISPTIFRARVLNSSNRLTVRLRGLYVKLLQNILSVLPSCFG